MGKIMLNGIQYGVGGIEQAKDISYDNTESGATATDVQGALDELNNGLTTQEIAITLNTSSWNSNNTKCYRMGNLVILNYYVQGTPANSKTIVTGCPSPMVGLSTSAGSPASVVSLGTNGTLYIQSAGTGTYIGGCLAYLTND